MSKSVNQAGMTSTIIRPNITREERVKVLNGIEREVNKIAWSLGMPKSRKYVLTLDHDEWESRA